MPILEEARVEAAVKAFSGHVISRTLNAPRRSHTGGTSSLGGARRHREEPLEPLQYFLVHPDGSVAELPANRCGSSSPKSLEVLPRIRH